MLDICSEQVESWDIVGSCSIKVGRTPRCCTGPETEYIMLMPLRSGLEWSEIGP